MKQIILSLSLVFFLVPQSALATKKRSPDAAKTSKSKTVNNIAGLAVSAAVKNFARKAGELLVKGGGTPAYVIAGALEPTTAAVSTWPKESEANILPSEKPKGDKVAPVNREAAATTTAELNKRELEKMKARMESSKGEKNILKEGGSSSSGDKRPSGGFAESTPSIDKRGT